MVGPAGEIAATRTRSDLANADTRSADGFRWLSEGLDSLTHRPADGPRPAAHRSRSREAATSCCSASRTAREVYWPVSRAAGLWGRRCCSDPGGPGWAPPSATLPAGPSAASVTSRTRASRWLGEPGRRGRVCRSTSAITCQRPQLARRAARAVSVAVARSCAAGRSEATTGPLPPVGSPARAAAPLIAVACSAQSASWVASGRAGPLFGRVSKVARWAMRTCTVALGWRPWRDRNSLISSQWRSLMWARRREKCPMSSSGTSTTSRTTDLPGLRVSARGAKSTPRRRTRASSTLVV